LFDLPTGNLYSLNETGSLIWNLMKEGLNSEEIVLRLTNRYDVSSEAAWAHLLALVAELEKKSLVRAEGKSRAPGGRQRRRQPG